MSSAFRGHLPEPSRPFRSRTRIVRAIKAVSRVPAHSDATPLVVVVSCASRTGLTWHWTRILPRIVCVFGIRHCKHDVHHVLSARHVSRAVRALVKQWRKKYRQVQLAVAMEYQRAVCHDWSSSSIAKSIRVQWDLYERFRLTESHRRLRASACIRW